MALPSAENAALCRALLEQGWVSRSQLDYASRKHAVTGGSLAGLLVRQALVAERDIGALLAQLRGVPFRAELAPSTLDTGLLQLFRRDHCAGLMMLPLALEEGELTVWLGEGEPERIADWVRRRLGFQVRFEQGPLRAVAQAIEQAYAPRREDAGALFERERQRIEQDEDGSLGTEPLMQALIGLAATDRATDIHLAPDGDAWLLSFRIDSVLSPVVALSFRAARLVSAIKVAAGMDIADTLRPQDGRFSHEAAGGTLDIRVSTIVTPSGESVALRLLQQGRYTSGLDDLAFYPEHVPMLNWLFAQPYGMVLMTGPTGSGKTTTLYAGLKPLGMSGKSILTVEDPVEYALPGACQTQVNRKAGYTFDSAIRHFLRHDPDIMLVGEIRDGETAQAAMRASETGHLVLSTLHVNNAFSVPRRLASLGVAMQSVADTLLGVVTQRLVRKLCRDCRAPAPCHADALPAVLRGRLDGALLYGPAGCMACRGSGYLGRLPVYEVLKLDRALAAWIVNGADRYALDGVLSEHNHVAMLDVFVRRLCDGDLSLEEFHRSFGAFDELAGA